MRSRWLAVVAIGLAACGPGVSVTVRAGDAELASTTPTTSGIDEPAITEPRTTEPEPTEPGSTAPPTTEPPTTAPTTTRPPIVDDGPIFELDDDKPAQDYDEFVEDAVNDIQRFWRVTYPEVYDDDFDELEGGVYPVYPGRTDVPGGCGMRRTTYRDVQGNAFYCGEGDFIAYDDDDLFPTVDREIGRFALAVALAHEFGHAIQQRARFGAETLLLEQQADCFAGAWSRWIADGNGAYVTFEESDLNVSMNGLILVRDEPGQVSVSPDAHGSAFDRVGAFQEGWFDGADRCRDFATDAPPSTLLPFTTNDITTGGNAPYADLLELLQTGLDTVWTALLSEEGVSFTPAVLDVGDDDTAARCPQVPEDALRIAFFCGPTNTVVASDERLRELYAKFGDNAAGLLLAAAYSGAVQAALGSDLTGEARALADDCLTGAWTAQLFPDPSREQEVTISAGDLDEGIQTLIAIGDSTSDENLRGSPFEKIDAFRSGVLGGLSACMVQMAG